MHAVRPYIKLLVGPKVLTEQHSTAEKGYENISKASLTVSPIKRALSVNGRSIGHLKLVNYLGGLFYEN